MRNEALSALEEISSRIMHTLKPYGIERLGVYYRNSRGEITIARIRTMIPGWLMKPGLRLMPSISIRTTCWPIRWRARRRRQFLRKKAPAAFGHFLLPWNGSPSSSTAIGSQYPSAAHRFAHI